MIARCGSPAALFLSADVHPANDDVIASRPVETRTSVGAEEPATKANHTGLIAAIVVVLLLAAIVGFVVVRKRNLQDEKDVAAAASAGAGAQSPTYAHREGGSDRAVPGRGGNRPATVVNSSYEENAYLVPTAAAGQQQQQQQQGQPQDQENQYLQPLVYDSSGVVGGAYADVDGLYSDSTPNYAELGEKKSQQAEYDVPGAEEEGQYVEANRSVRTSRDTYLAPTPLAGESLYDTAADGTAGMENGAYYDTAGGGAGEEATYATAAMGGPVETAHHYEYADAAVALAAASGGPTYAVASDGGVGGAADAPLYAVATSEVGGSGAVVYDVGTAYNGAGSSPQYDVAASAAAYDVAQGDPDDGYLAVGGGRTSSVRSHQLQVVECDDNIGNEFC